MKKNSQVIKESVERLGGKIESLKTKRGCWRIIYKNKTFYIKGKFRIFKNCLDTAFLAYYKDLTCEIFKQNSFFCPQTAVVSEDDKKKKIIETLQNIRLPIVLKDTAGSLSVGVFANITSKKQALNILQKELKIYKKMLIQEMVFGNEYRVLVLEDKILGVLQMVPPYIIGNGKNSVFELIEEKQRKTKRKTPHNEELRRLLEDQGEKLETVPRKGKKVFLRKNSCLAEGGEMIDVTDEIHSSLARECSRLADVCGLALAGIDLFCDDITLPIRKQRINFIEVNSLPDLNIHYFPTIGQPRDVVRAILDYVTERI